MITGSHLRQNAPQIQAAIKEAEWKLIPEAWRSKKFFGNILIPLNGPRLPEYQGTPVERTLAHLDKLALPSDYHFVDLGAGRREGLPPIAILYIRANLSDKKPSRLLKDHYLFIIYSWKSINK